MWGCGEFFVFRLPVFSRASFMGTVLNAHRNPGSSVRVVGPGHGSIG